MACSGSADEALHFRGFARLRLSALNFEHERFTAHRSVSEQNVTRLLNIFRIEGCRKSEERYSIKAVVDESDLDAALADQPLCVFQQPQENWTAIPEFNIATVNCLNGLHRIYAARQLLVGNERWWVVQLFTSGLGVNTCENIVEEYGNEQPNTDGEIFFKIRFYQQGGNPALEQRWWARLSATKRNDLRQLLRDERFQQAFDALLPWPGLWTPIKLGSLHRLLTMKCDQELLRHLDHIARIWSTILHGVDSASCKDAVDVDSVQILQALAPAASAIDEAEIRAAIQSHQLFPKITAESARSDILRNLLSVRCMIPSLFTFFEDLKYLEPAAKVLRGLLPPKQKRSIFEALSASYRSPSQLHIECGPDDVRVYNPPADQDSLLIGYYQLWLFALRNFPIMTDITPRKDECKEKPMKTEPSPIVWQKFGSLAMSLGFETAAAKEYQGSDGELEIAEQLLRRCNFGTQQDELVTRIASVLKGGGRTCGVSRYGEFASDQLVPRDRRCGRPLESDHDFDKECLFLPSISQPPPAGQGQHITTFYCKWDMFRSFFGEGIPHVQCDNPDVTVQDENSQASDGVCELCGFSLLDNRTLESRCRELDSRLHQEHSKITRLETDLNQARRSELDLNNVIQSLQRERDALKADNAQLERSQNETQMQKTIIDDLRSQLSALRDQVESDANEAVSHALETMGDESPELRTLDVQRRDEPRTEDLEDLLRVERERREHDFSKYKTVLSKTPAHQTLVLYAIFPKAGRTTVEYGLFDVSTSKSLLDCVRDLDQFRFRAGWLAPKAVTTPMSRTVLYDTWRQCQVLWAYKQEHAGLMNNFMAFDEPTQHVRSFIHTYGWNIEEMESLYPTLVLSGASESLSTESDPSSMVLANVSRAYKRKRQDYDGSLVSKRPRADLVEQQARAGEHVGMSQSHEGKKAGAHLRHSVDEGELQVRDTDYLFEDDDDSDDNSL